MKIKKFADGGTGFITFRSTIAPWVPPEQQAAASTQSNNQNLVDDEMYKMLIDKGGLKNDVDAFAQQLNALSDDPMSFLSSGNDHKARRMFAQINTLRVNKEMWDNSLKQAEAQGGINEVAVGSRGELYVKDKDGNTGAISMGDYVKAPDKYNPLTVAELLVARQYDPNFVNNQSVFTVAENAIGLDKIIDHIKDIVSSIGEETIANEYYIKNKDIPKGAKEQMQQLSAVIGEPSTDIKIKIESMTERGNLDQAYRYIWNTLGRQAQLKLTATAALNGEVDKNGNPSPQQIILDALTIGTSVSRKVSTEDLKTVNGLTATSSGSSTGMENIRPLEILAGLLPSNGTFEWNDPKNSHLKIQLPANVAMKLPYSNGTPLGPSTLDKISKSDIGGMLKTENIYYGSNKVGAVDKDKIVYDGDTAARVFLPVDDTGKPNYFILKEIEQLKKSMQPGLNYKEQSDYYRRHGLDINVSADGEFLESSLLKPFLVFYGYAEEGAQATQNNNEISKLGKDTEVTKDDAKQVLHSTWVGEKKVGKSGTLESRSFLIGNDYYKGIVAIPFNDKMASVYASTLYGHGPRYKPLTKEDTMFKLQTSGRSDVANKSIDFSE